MIPSPRTQLQTYTRNSLRRWSRSWTSMVCSLNLHQRVIPMSRWDQSKKGKEWIECFSYFNSCSIIYCAFPIIKNCEHGECGNGIQRINPYPVKSIRVNFLVRTVLYVFHCCICLMPISSNFRLFQRRVCCIWVNLL